MTSRMKTLLSLASSALRDGTDPFGEFFLRENKVSLDEAFEMSQILADMIVAFIGVGA